MGEHKQYTSDLTEQERQRIEPLLLDTKSVGQLREADLRDALDTNLCRADNGTEWRNSPKDKALEEARKQYQYNYTYFPPLALVDKLPRSEFPHNSWIEKLVQIGVKILGNRIIARRGDREVKVYKDDAAKFLWPVLWKVSEEEPLFRRKLVFAVLKNFPKMILKRFHLSPTELEELAKDAFNTLEVESLKNISAGIKDEVASTKAQGAGLTLAEYEQQFVVIPLPPISKYFEEDEFFAYQRVAGPNPVMIERVNVLQGNKLSDRFPVTNSYYQAVMGQEDSLEAAVAEQRLYCADYGIFAGAINGAFPEFQKYIAAPLALFAVPRNQLALRPVAIQCGQTPGLPILLPPGENATDHDRAAWKMAKNVVQVADTNCHEAVTHLGRTHLFLSPFALAMHRQLVTSHPIYQLLHPHFEGTFFINNGAQSMLMAPKGGVDGTLAVTIDCARVCAITGVLTYGFNDAMLPDQLHKRGVDNSQSLPLYPYRDDAMLLWEAIREWVSDYIGIYYSDDTAVRSDDALQAWAKELQAFDGGRVPNFGENGTIQTRDYLIRALTLIIYTASAQHAAVNFPQGDQMMYVPGVPMAAYVHFDGTSPVSEATYFEQLPPLKQAEAQLELCYTLGNIIHTQLGKYEKDWFKNADVLAKLAIFQKRLSEIETIIDGRNKQRPYPYEYLKPSRIPQSINI
jgi:arachidonate 15-lipoxygenase